MTDQTPTENVVNETPSRKLRNPFAKKADDTQTDAQSKLKTIASKAKTGAAVVGVIAIAAGVAAVLSKKSNVDSVQVTLPDVEVQTEEV